MDKTAQRVITLSIVSIALLIGMTAAVISEPKGWQIQYGKPAALFLIDSFPQPVFTTEEDTTTAFRFFLKENYACECKLQDD